MRLVACPVALHPDGGIRRIAICQHPTQGLQLLSAPSDTEQAATATAARHLYAVSGLETRAALPIGTSPDIQPDAHWHFALCRIVPPVRDRWQHLCAHSSQLLQFSWISLDAAVDGLDAKDARALDWIKTTL
ncbi:hypothetical protein [uncultured Sulfitobacter sp.]|uniref:hypothetical protein n=1 Tax=uncultured Sulfitobacter sp. TaxID=191468 RepID=UPI002611A462|nr:hypothetical protein [uncultured Sulfitobacter sp.]